MSFDSKELSQHRRIQVHCLGKEFTTLYDGTQYDDQIRWKCVITSKNLTTNAEENSQEVDEMIAIPYACPLLECEAFIEAPSHSLYCLIKQIVVLSPTKSVHIEKICCQLAKLSRIYYEKPFWELRQEIRHEVQTQKAAVKLEGDFCVLTEWTVISLECNMNKLTEYVEGEEPSKVKNSQSKKGKLNHIYTVLIELMAAAAYILCENSPLVLLVFLFIFSTQFKNRRGQKLSIDKVQLHHNSQLTTATFKSYQHV